MIIDYLLQVLKYEYHTANDEIMEYIA